MNKLIHILICCVLFSLAWSCDDDDDTKTSGKEVEVAFGSKEFKTLENITPLQLAVVLSAPAGQQVTVTGYVKSENNAKEGTDYTFITKEITIPAGKSTGYFEVEIKDYPEYTPDRSFIFEIVNVEGARLSALDACQVVIGSNEGLPEIGFSKTLISVAEESRQTEVSVGLTHIWDKDISFRIRTLAEKSTAVFGEHYTLDTLSTYIIPAGDTAVIIPVTIIDDIIDNENRYFELEVYGNTESILSEVYRTMKITLLDDEEPVYVCFERTNVKGTESEGPIWVPIRVKGNPKTPVKVILEPRSGKAQENKDYTFTNREFTFQVGNKLDSVQVMPIDNDEYDLDRSFNIGFASVEGAQLASSDTLISVTIQNDDFDFVQLYDDLMGEWIMKSSVKDNSPAEWTVIISGGKTPEEEDANYLKKLIIHAERYVQGGWNTTLDIPLYYDVNTGAITVGFGEVIAAGVSTGKGVVDLKLGYTSSCPKIKIPTTPSKDYKTIAWEPGKKIGGFGHKGDTYASIVLFYIQDIVLTRNEE